MKKFDQFIAETIPMGTRIEASELATKMQKLIQSLLGPRFTVQAFNINTEAFIGIQVKGHKTSLIEFSLRLPQFGTHERISWSVCKRRNPFQIAMKPIIGKYVEEANEKLLRWLKQMLPIFQQARLLHLQESLSIATDQNDAREFSKSFAVDIQKTLAAVLGPRYIVTSRIAPLSGVGVFVDIYHTGVKVTRHNSPVHMMLSFEFDYPTTSAVSWVADQIPRSIAFRKLKSTQSVKDLNQKLVTYLKKTKPQMDKILDLAGL